MSVFGSDGTYGNTHTHMQRRTHTQTQWLITSIGSDGTQERENIKGLIIIHFAGVVVTQIAPLSVPPPPRIKCKKHT